MKNKRLYFLFYALIFFTTTLLSWQLLCDSLFNSNYFYLLFAIIYFSEILTYSAAKYKKIFDYFLKTILFLLIFNLVFYRIYNLKPLFYVISIVTFTAVKKYLHILRIKNINQKNQNLGESKKVKNEYNTYHILLKLSAIAIPLLSLLYQGKHLKTYLIYSYIVLIALVVMFELLFRKKIKFCWIPVSWKKLSKEYKSFLTVIISLYILYPYIMKSILVNAREYNIFVLIKTVLSIAIIYAGFKINNRNFIITTALLCISFTSIFIFDGKNIMYSCAVISSVLLILAEYFLEWHIAVWKNKDQPLGEARKPFYTRIISGDIGEIKTIQLLIGLVFTGIAYLVLETLKFDLKIPGIGISLILIYVMVRYTYNMGLCKSGFINKGLFCHSE